MDAGFLGVPDVDPLIFFGLMLTSLLAALVTGVAGAAGGLLLLGVLAAVFPPSVLIPVHTFVMLGDNCGRVAIMWRHILWRALLPFFIGAAAGAAVGGQVFVSLPNEILQVGLGVLIIFFTWMPKIASVGSLRGRFGLVGFAATFFGMFVSATGVLVGPFVAAACKDRRDVIGTFSATMMLVHLCKLVAFGFLGVTLTPYLPLIGAMLVTTVIGNLTASRILNHIPEHGFRIVFRLLLTALALRILWVAASNTGQI